MTGRTRFVNPSLESAYPIPGSTMPTPGEAMPELNEPIGYSRRAVLGGIGAGSAALFGLTMAGRAVAAPGPLPPPGLDYGVDVRKQGARGDGETDDTAAFVRALALAQSTSGYLVIVPPGTYRLAQPLAAVA